MDDPYTRSTRLCSFGQLQPAILQAIREYALEHELGTIEAELLICAETTTEMKKKGLFAPKPPGGLDRLHYIGMLVTPGWLIWAVHGEKYGTTVQAARLKDIRVKDFSSPRVQASGLEVFGFIGDSPGRVTAFIGLGTESAAYQFSQVLKEAVAKAQE
jgi:hypothetical protein